MRTWQAVAQQRGLLRALLQEGQLRVVRRRLAACFAGWRAALLHK